MWSIKVNLLTCSDCKTTGPEDEYAICENCGAVLCPCCGKTDSGQLLCRDCEEDYGLNETDLAYDDWLTDYSYSPEGTIKTWAEDKIYKDKDGKIE